VLGVFISTHVFKPVRIIVFANAAEKFDNFETLDSALLRVITFIVFEYSANGR
jgi:hypothetical protein